MTTTRIIAELRDMADEYHEGIYGGPRRILSATERLKREELLRELIKKLQAED